MQLSQLYSAMVESERVAKDREVRQAIRPPAAPSPKEVEQDRRIRTLEHENDQLKSCFTALVQLMCQRGALDPDEADELVEEAYSAPRRRHVTSLDISESVVAAQMS